MRMFLICVFDSELKMVFFFDCISIQPTGFLTVIQIGNSERICDISGVCKVFVAYFDVNNKEK